MKKLILCFILISNCALVCAQSPSSPSYAPLPNYSQPGLTYQQALDGILYHFNDPTDTTEGSSFLKISKWKRFWQDRICADFPNGKNAFTALAELAKFSIDNPHALCSETDGKFQGNWSSIGPDTLPNNMQALGLFNTVWASPTDSNFILAGSGMGGLWKTTDGGAHWHNITDNANIAGTMGVMSIAVNPSNPNEIWLATPSHYHLQGSYWFNDGYHYGVIRTMDGGATWQHEPFFVGPNGLLSIEHGVDKLLYAPDGTLWAFNKKKIFMKKQGQAWSVVHTLGGQEAITDTFFTDIAFLPSPPHRLIASTNSIIDLVDSVGNALLYEYSDSDGTILHQYMHDSIVKYYGNPVHTNIASISIPNNNNVYYDYDDVFIVQGPPPIFAPQIKRLLILGHIDRTTGIIDTNITRRVTNTAIIGKLIVSPNNPNTIYFGSPQNVGGVAYMSVDGGEIFAPISTYWGEPTHGDIRGMYLQTSSPLDSGRGDLLFFASDGGIGKKPAGSVYNFGQFSTRTCVNINGRGLAVTQFYGMADQDGQEKFLSGGAIHNGMFACEGDQSIPWKVIQVTDAVDCEFDAVNRDKAYYQLGYPTAPNNFQGQLYASDTGGGRKIDSRYSYQQDHIMLHQEKYENAFPINISETSKKLYVGKERLWVKDSTWLNDGNWRRYGPLGSYHPRGYYSDQVWGIDSLPVRCFAIGKNDLDDRKAYVCYFSQNSKGDQLVSYTPDGGLNWYDATPQHLLSSASNAGHRSPISAIAIGDQNPNKVWLGQSQINMGSDGKPTNSRRVLYTEDDPFVVGSGNVVWKDLSKGLPPHPVTSLVYQSGSDDVVYAGTDVGVYRFVKQEPIDSSFWVCFNDGFPKSLINDLEINYCSGKLRAATHGRGMWESDLYHASSGNIGTSKKVDAGGTTTLTGDVYIEGSITVEAGNTLLIKGTATNPTTIHMPKWGRINVKKGAHLIVDGATITNSCNTMWLGIFIDGDDNLSQTPLTNQGVCELKNGAVIENSENGVANYWTGLGGGIIIANNATFKNNRRSAAFLKYQNYISNTIIPKADVSYFKNCSFIVDDDYPSTGPVFTYHISLWGMDRVKITGCSFDNQMTNALHTGKGIACLDGSILVNETSNAGNPSSPVVPSTFNNLEMGIDLGGYNLLSNAIVVNSDFSENKIGIQMLGHDNGTFGLNEFENLSTTWGVGLYANECPHYNISENEFVGSNAHNTVPTFGTWIANTYANDNFVYKNTFKDLAYGSVSEEYNHGYQFGGGAPREYGVRFNCNTNTNNFRDIYVGPSGSQYGIHSNQLSISSLGALQSAGNTFSQNSPSQNSIGWDFANYGQGIRYYHSGGTTDPLYNDGTISKMTTLPATNCDARYNPNVDPIDFPTSRLTSAIIRYNSLHASLVTALYNHQQVIDDGSTNQMVGNVSETWNDNAWTLRNNLLAESPYLSNEVLRQTGEENILPQAMYLEIILANPEASREREFLEFLQYELANPLPTYMIKLNCG